MTAERVCEVCGASIEDRSAAARCCSAGCRAEASRRRRGLSPKGARPDARCVRCEAVIAGRRADAKYCSDECRRAAERQRRDARDPDLVEAVARRAVELIHDELEAMVARGIAAALAQSVATSNGSTPRPKAPPAEPQRAAVRLRALTPRWETTAVIAARLRIPEVQARSILVALEERGGAKRATRGEGGAEVWRQPDELEAAR